MGDARLTGVRVGAAELFLRGQELRKGDLRNEREREKRKKVENESGERDGKEVQAGKAGNKVRKKRRERQNKGKGKRTRGVRKGSEDERRGRKWGREKRELAMEQKSRQRSERKPSFEDRWNEKGHNRRERGAGRKSGSWEAIEPSRYSTDFNQGNRRYQAGL